MVLTLPDNPTGRLARPDSVRALCQVAARARPDHHLRRDLPRPGARPGRRVPQPGGLRAGADRGHHRAEQEPGPGRLADRRGPAAGRQHRPGAAGPAARHRQRDLVRALAAHPARRGPRVQRTGRTYRTHARRAGRCTPRWRRRWPDRFRAAGLRVPAPQAAFYLYPDFAPWRAPAPRGLRASAPGPNWPGTCCTGTAMGMLPGSAFGEDDDGAADAGGHRAAVRRDRRAAGDRAGRPPTRCGCPGSPPRWTAPRTCWPTWPRPRAASATGPALGRRDLDAPGPGRADDLVEVTAVRCDQHLDTGAGGRQHLLDQPGGRVDEGDVGDPAQLLQHV